jgi:hypothetical protein
MTLRQSLIPGVMAVGMLLVLFGLFRTPDIHASLSAPAVGAGKVSEANPFRPPYSQVLVASDSLTHTQFLPAIFSNYERPVPTAFGVQMYGELSEEQVSLSLAQEAKVYWVRWPLAWASVEPTNTVPENYHWDVGDASLPNAAQARVHPIVTIVSNPGWAATYANGPIDKVDVTEFAQFVGALAERYDGDGWEDAPGSPVVDYWEFYNEPDAGDELRARYGASYWGHFGAEYAQMLCAVHPAIKAANPRAQVVLGGLAYDHFEPDGGFVREFLDDVLEAGGGNCFDVMNFHYYPVFEGAWATYGYGLSGKANYLYDKLGQYGLEGKPMISTEAGWHSDDFGQFPSTPTIQARYVVKLFSQSLASHLEQMTWWTWIDPEGYYGANGLLTQSLQPKPAYYAYQAAAAKLGRATFEEIWTLGDPDVEAYRFSSRTGEPLYVLWANDETTHTVSLPLSRAGLVDMYGGLISVVNDSEDGSTDGHIQVSAGPNPVYVEARP